LFWKKAVFGSVCPFRFVLFPFILTLEVPVTASALVLEESVIVVKTDKCEEMPDIAWLFVLFCFVSYCCGSNIDWVRIILRDLLQ
jgi:hypothetical protein